MSAVPPLILELIEKRPLSAIKILKETGASDAAAFFEVLPARMAAALMDKISTGSAAPLIAEMAPTSAAAILTELDHQAAASIMRLVPEAARAALLPALPEKLSKDLKAALTYPPDTVGANMSTTIVMMDVDQTVSEAFAALRQIKRTKTGVAYVVDASRKLLGAVTAEELLQLADDHRLGDVMDTAIAPVSARAGLGSVLTASAWGDYAHLPVVNREKILIGALARRALAQDISEKLAQTARPHSMLSAVAGAFFASSAGLAELLIDAEIPSDAAGDDRNSKHKSTRAGGPA